MPEVTQREQAAREATTAGSTAGSEPASNGAKMRAPIFDCQGIEVHYGEKLAVRDVNLSLAQHEITALIGPSGCGKSTFIRCLNRMNDLIPSARVGGSVVYHGEDLYADEIDPVAVRKRIGMVFQKPNPFP